MTGRGRELVLAAPRSLCAGVERAIDTIERVFLPHGARNALLTECGISARGICDLVSRVLPPTRAHESAGSSR